MIHRLRYRHGVPFIMSALLAVVITAWPLIREAFFHLGTSIWTFAVLATIATAFTILCGGRYRAFFITIAVMPPFIFILGWYNHTRSAMLYFPFKAFIEYFLYFVAAPILLMWIAATLLNRKERHA